ncbi:class I SAM-dependent methyltransferase [Leifsonia sp. Le1]|uniref:class I SAM-dependent methyltransferase n=1 Tax=Leifsonia sp. Le1 TaxID=3404918 RepID=UPI003EBB170E
MSAVGSLTRDRTAAFGRGGAEPYDLALRGGGGRLDVVVDGRAATPLDVSLFLSDATEHERQLLGLTSGPVLDIGCGPGRIVRAAIEAGRLALGIDISSAAVSHARALGLPVLRRSVFDRLPAEGAWGAAVLLDGNIGIGGDPRLLLARASAMLGPGGRMLVETHAEPSRFASFDAQLVHPSGGRSAWFPWAEVGADAAGAFATELGMNVRTVETGGRTFVLASR